MHLQLLLIFFTLATLKFIFKKLKEYILLQDIPGPRGLPLLGNSLQLKDNQGLNKLSEWVEEYGTRFKISIGSRKYIIIANAKDIEKILSSQIHIDKGREYQFLWPWIGTSGLFSSTGTKWQQKRKRLEPLFNFKSLEDFLGTMNEQSKVLMRCLKKLEHEDKFDICPYINRTTLDIIIETAMGKKIKVQTDPDSNYFKAVSRLSKLIQHRSFRPWLHSDFLWRLSSSGREESRCVKVVHSLSEKAIKDRKEERDRLDRNLKKKKKDDNLKISEGKFHQSILEYLLEAQKKAKEPYSISDLEIQQEIDTFIFAGHGSTAANVSWTIFLLGHNSEVQEKVQEELDEIFGTSKLAHPLTMNDLSRMKYLEMCIKESLRIFPSVPTFSRDIHTDFQLDEKTIIPQGVSITCLAYETHRDSKVYSNPEKFIPERFSPINSLDRKAHAFIPFSVGPRDCVGQKFAMMEAKVLIGNVFKKFNVISMGGREDITLDTADLFLTSKNGIVVKLIARE